MKWKFKLLFLTSTILIVVSAFVLNWTTFHAGKRAGLKEGEIYVQDGTEIYVASDGSLMVEGEGIKIAEEGEDRLLLSSKVALEQDLVFYPGTFVAPTQIVIHGEGDEEICVLDWSTGKLEFRGKMNSSARSFFKYFLKPYVDEYITEELGKKDEISILSCKEAIELRQEFPISYYFKDMLWPMSQSLSIERFIEWLYFNDCKIIKKRK